MTFTLPNLPYAYDALRPICRRKRWNITTTSITGLRDQRQQRDQGDRIRRQVPRGDRQGLVRQESAVFNNAGQHYNHLHFWNWMKPNGGGSKLPGRLEKKITEDLGGLEKFKTDFAAAGVGQFGSGWCWLSVKNGKLEISKTPNGESPLVHGATPILGCDVWEHSYYIDYRNRRPDYLKAFVDHL